MILIKAALGALMNRIRGGGLTDFVWKYNIADEGDETFWKSFSKISNDLVFALTFCFILLHSFDIGLVVILYLFMWIGRSFGWGTYIAGIIEKKVRDEEEIKWIDKLVLNKTDYPVLRNTFALCFRGLMWGVSIAFGFGIAIVSRYEIPLSTLFIIPISFLMGPAYLLASIIGEYFGDRGRGWQLGEILYGFLLWGGLALII